MHPPFSLRRRSSYPWWFALAFAIALAAFYLLPERNQSPQLLLSGIGGIAAFFHFLYSQHNTNTDRFIKLFQDFNSRYDRLNDQLNLIEKKREGPIVEELDIQTLYDYFNLCAEEYMYFKSGYIDKEVWSAWIKGMQYFANNPEILKIWQHELDHGSYYGFTLKLLENAA